MPRTDGRTARWAGHREQRRAVFVDAALAVIERVGPGATVDQIAAELGVTRQAIYRQFTDRSDLDHAIAERAAALLFDELLPHFDAGSELLGDVEGSIARLTHVYLDFVERNLSLYRFVRAHELELAADSAVRTVKDTVAGRVAALAEQVLATLDLPAGMAETFAVGMIGMTDAVVSRWLEDPRGLSRAELVDQLTRILGGAVRAATSS